MIETELIWLPYVLFLIIKTYQTISQSYDLISI